MPYTSRQLLLIKYGICLDCEEESSGRYRRCLRCRQKRAKPKRMPAEYEKQRRARNAAERAAGRGYWPEIHGRA